MGTAITNGEVNLTVNQRGTGDLPKKLDETRRGIESVTSRVGALKEGARPVNVLRESFENLRSNATFLIGSLTGLGGIVVGVVGAIGDFISGNDNAARAVAAWDAQQRNFNAAIEQGWDALEKFSASPVDKALQNVNIQLARAGTLINDIREDEEEYEKKLKDIEKLKRVQKALEEDIAREAQKTRDHWRDIEKSLENAALLQPPLISPFTGNDDSLKVDRNSWGEVESPEQRAAREKRLRLALADARKRGGGRREEDIDKVFEDLVKEQRGLAGYRRGAIETLGTGGAAKKNTAQAGFPGLGEGGVTSKRGRLAGEIRDFAAALSEALPGMDAFSGALGRISQLWGDVATSGKGAAQATIMSLGALAQAGAQSIKNERARAGVLALIELGLGLGLQFVAGRQAEAEGHFAAAATLGIAALGGGIGAGRGAGGRGGGGGAGAASSSYARPLSDPRSGNITNVINTGVYVAGRTEQEAAAEWARVNRGAAASGHIPWAA